jgi:outer membrane lipoprotein-sorting protein
MKRWMLMIVVLPALTSLLFAAPAKDEQAEAEAILDNAIKAAGGQEKLAKLTSFVLKMNRKSTPRGEGPTLVTTAEISYEFPDRKRMESTRDLGGTKTTTVQILNGDKVWLTSRGATRELTVDQAARVKADPFTDFPVRQLPLYKGKGYKLTMLGESKVEEKRVVGVKVSSEGKPDARLFFDKDTGLLVKREYELNRAVLAGGGVPAGGEEPKPVTVEIIYEDYEEAAGVRYPTKTTRFQGGQKIGEDEVTEFKVVEKFDEKTFAKPE